MLKITPLANIFNAMKEPAKKHQNSKWGAFLLMLAVGFGGWQIGLPELASFFNNIAFIRHSNFVKIYNSIFKNASKGKK